MMHTTLMQWRQKWCLRFEYFTHHKYYITELNIYVMQADTEWHYHMVWTATFEWTLKLMAPIRSKSYSSHMTASVDSFICLAELSWPVDAVVSSLHPGVNLQDGLIIHIGLSVALQWLIGHCSAQQGLQGVGLQLQSPKRIRETQRQRIKPSTPAHCVTRVTGLIWGSSFINMWGSICFRQTDSYSLPR